jgi:hypothetical protein
MGARHLLLPAARDGALLGRAATYAAGQQLPDTTKALRYAASCAANGSAQRHRT